MWIIFEGLDKSGKTTLEWELLKATNFKHIIIDRGPVGYAVFDALFERTTEQGKAQYARNVVDMKETDNFLVVYCKVPIDVAMQRLKEHNETCPYDYKAAQRAYDYAIELLYKTEGIKVLTVNTEKSIEDCVNFIINMGGLK